MKMNPTFILLALTVLNVAGFACIWKQMNPPPIQTKEQQRERLNGLEGKTLWAAFYQNDGRYIELMFSDGDCLELNGSAGGIYLRRSIERHPEQWKPKETKP